MYCLFEHSFYTREGDEQRTVFRFTPVSAPIKCTVFPLLNRDEFNKVAQSIGNSLSNGGVSNNLDTTGTTIGKKCVRRRLRVQSMHACVRMDATRSLLFAHSMTAPRIAHPGTRARTRSAFRSR